MTASFPTEVMSSATLRRTPVVSYLHGERVIPISTDTLISVSVQPAKEEDVRGLPDGVRGKRAFRVYTMERLFGTQGGVPADQIQLGGSWYTVAEVAVWELPFLYSRAIVTLNG